METGVGRQELTWSHDGRRLAIATSKDSFWEEPCTLQIWSFVESGTGGTLQWSEPVCVSTLQWSPSDRWIAFWHSRSEFVFSDSADPTSMRALPGIIESSEWHPTQDWLAVADEQNTVRVFDPARSVYLWKHENPDTFERRSIDIAWSPDGNQLAMIVSSGQKSISGVNEAGTYTLDWPAAHGINVWNLQHNQIEPVIKISDDATMIKAIDWLSPNRIASLSRSRNEVTNPDWLGIWDIASGERVAGYLIAGGGSASGCCVTWSPDHEHFAALVQWRIFSTRIFGPDMPSDGLTLPFDSAVWSPDSRYITTRRGSFLWHMDIQIQNITEYKLFHQNGAFEIRIAEPGASDRLFFP